MPEPRTLEGWLLSTAGDPRLKARAEVAARELERIGARVLAPGDPGYPPGLSDLPGPPPAVFVRGGPLPDPGRAVAVVGSRAATRYGVGFARRLAADLARLGCTVVSGLARGIDAAAHEGALEAGGRTLAVLPGGLDCVTPRHHRELAERIAASGALLTERGFGPPRFRGEFVERNRLIAALCAATVVVEAAARSGALSTAAWAKRLGRAVLAVPGDVDRETSRGCHALLRAGGLLCEGAGDVARAVAGWRASRGEASAGRGESVESRLLDALDREPRSLEALARAAGTGVAETLAGLLALQWAGMAAAHAGQRWARTG